MIDPVDLRLVVYEHFIRHGFPPSISTLAASRHAEAGSAPVT
jgi:hypothetical protein